MCMILITSIDINKCKVNICVTDGVNSNNKV